MSSVLFVCTGNICRSPSAEGVMRGMMGDMPKSFMLDSAGTHGYHIGEAPDSRSIKTAASRGYSIGDLRARQIKPDDFNRFRLILAMDSSHEEHLLAMQPRGSSAEVKLFLPYSGVTEASEVPDPYYGSQRDFEHTLDLIEAGIEGLLNKLRNIA